MPTDYENGGTLKRCPPFLEAMTAGYIIPIPADLSLEMDAGGEVKAYWPPHHQRPLSRPVQRRLRLRTIAF